MTGSIEVQVVRLAKSVAFAQKEYGVILGQTAQLSVTVSPEDTTDKSVSYQSNNPKKVSVDENGVVTALAAGKGHLTATTTDGSRRQATHSREGDRPRDRGSLRYAGTPGWAWTTTGR